MSERSPQQESDPSNEEPPPQGRLPGVELPPGEAIPSETLFHGQREVLIQHGEHVYRLVRTRNGKLLLNKE